MKILKIKDNSKINKEEFYEYTNIINKISDKTLGELNIEGIFVFPEVISDADDITRDQMILQSYNNFYRTSNVMGFIGYNNQKIIIESRFSSQENDYFTRYLLERLFKISNIIDLTTNFNQDNKIFNLFIFLFSYYLKNAVKKGVFKTYIRKNYNDSNVKGIIDISKHINKNTPFIGNIAYSNREYSYDNYLIQLIRHTIEFIKKKPYGKNILLKVKDEVNLIINLTERYKYYNRNKIIKENKKNIVRHAYYREYRILQRLCLLILQYEKHEIGLGINKIYGILFDGSWLWEEYINLLIGDIFYHPMNKSRKNGQRLFYNNSGLIYPDFISKDYNNTIIADAKYKPINNINGRDYIQILAYMFRFNAKKGFFFYPDINNENVNKLWLNEGTTYENNVVGRNDTCVVKIGFKIPDNCKNYMDFSKKMQYSENIFKKTVFSYIN